MSVFNPRSKPFNPPKALNAANDFGFRVLFNWPGENANGLLATSKSFSFVLSGHNASSVVSSSPSNRDRIVLTSELALDLAVSAVELKEFALDLKVSPPNECVVGDEGT